MTTPVLAVVWVLVVGLLVPPTLLEVLECFATIIIIVVIASTGLLDLALPRVPWISPEEQGEPILLPGEVKTSPLLVMHLELPPPTGMTLKILPLLVKGTFPAAAVEAPV